MAIDQFNEENKREKLELMSTIEVEKKEAEQQVVQQYMSHFLLGIKVNCAGTTNKYKCVLK